MNNLSEGEGRSRGGLKRVYDKAFKHEAVRLVLEGGRTVAEVSRNLGICQSVLHRWKRQYREDPEHSFPGKGRLKPMEEDLRRLKRELADAGEDWFTFDKGKNDVVFRICTIMKSPRFVCHSKWPIAYFSRGPR